jgi:hypothetical protein
MIFEPDYNSWPTVGATMWNNERRPLLWQGSRCSPITFASSHIRSTSGICLNSTRLQLGPGCLS